MATAARSTRSSTRRTPQDRKPKATPSARVTAGHFAFTHKGKKHTFPKPFSVVRSPGFMRANRRRDQLDLTFTMIEELAGDSPEGEAILAVIDSMSDVEFTDLSNRMGQALRDDTVGGEMTDALGESEGS